jgi:hypothetical protein
LDNAGADGKQSEQEEENLDEELFEVDPELA